MNEELLRIKKNRNYVLKKAKKLLEQVIRNQIAKDTGIGPTKSQVTKKTATDLPLITPPERMSMPSGPISPYRTILEYMLNNETLLNRLLALGLEPAEIDIHLSRLFTPEQLRAIAMILSLNPGRANAVATILIQLIVDYPKRERTRSSRKPSTYSVATVNMTKAEAAQFDLLLQRLLILVDPTNNINYVQELIAYLELFAGGFTYTDADGNERFNLIFSEFLRTIREDINFDILGNFTLQELIQLLIEGSTTGSGRYPEKLLELGFTRRQLESLIGAFFDYSRGAAFIRREFEDFLRAGLGDQYEEWVNNGSDVDLLIQLLDTLGHIRISQKLGSLKIDKDSDLNQYTLNMLMQIIAMLKLFQNLDQIIQ